jgi:hypothetical protein
MLKKAPKVSIIIVSWNGKNWLEQCLESLYTQHYQNIEIIVVDNNSSDESVAFLKKKYPKVKTISNETNLGFAQANNVGLAQATGEYILFLNNDTKVTPDFLEPLVEVLKKNPHIGGVQSRIRLLEKPDYLDSVAAYLTFTGMIYHYGIAKKDQSEYQKRIATFSAKGACMLFKKQVLDEVMVNNELFDSSYFAYFEETDMCHRVWLAGYHIVFEPKSLIYHQMGGTSTAMQNSFIQFHSFKNRINSYLKNLSFISLLLLLPIHFFVIQAFALASLLQGKIEIFLAIERAIGWNIMQIPQTLKKRQYIQTTIRQVSDATINPHIMVNPRLSYYLALFKGLDHYQDTFRPHYAS